MISARLNGGLGNQMFQVATTCVLAWDHGDMPVFDFGMKPMFQGNGTATYRSNVFRKLVQRPRGWKPVVVYKEPSYDYIPIPYARHMELVGYFSCERYIAHRRMEVLDLFTDKETIGGLREEYGDKLKNSVSLHVRRGDYTTFDKVYVLLEKNYYSRALHIMEALTHIDNILVFSDDMTLCEKMFSDPRITFVRTDADYKDMYLMSMCDNNIMANSSFSWWGAYLNDNPDKIVISPATWFGDKGPRCSSHLYCQGWIMI